MSMWKVCKIRMSFILSNQRRTRGWCDENHTRQRQVASIGCTYRIRTIRIHSLVYRSTPIDLPMPAPFRSLFTNSCVLPVIWYVLRVPWRTSRICGILWYHVLFVICVINCSFALRHYTYLLVPPRIFTLLNFDTMLGLVFVVPEPVLSSLLWGRRR